MPKNKKVEQEVQVDDGDNLVMIGWDHIRTPTVKTQRYMEEQASATLAVMIPAVTSVVRKADHKSAPFDFAALLR